MTLPARSAPLAHEAETLARRAAELGRAAKAANTRTAYAGDWARFSQWCAGLQLTALPAAPATVGLYVAELVGANLVGRRNRALLVTGWVGALRGAELVSIALEHLTETPDGYRLLVPHSKGDRTGQGQLIGLPRDDLNPDLCPVRALKAWLQAADIETGPVFFPINGQGQVESFGDHLTDRGLRKILKGLASRAGLKPTEVALTSSHSLRAGHLTTGYLEAVPERALQDQARHKDPKTTRKYFRPATLFQGNSAKGLLAK